MLAKLLKYEIPAVARKLLPLYAALIVVSILFGLNFRGEYWYRNSSILTVISAMLFAAAVTAVFVMSIIVMIQRYNDNLMGDGGYFSWALPVKVDTHLMNKTISAGIWYLVGAIGIVTSVFLVAMSSGAVNLIDLIRELIMNFESLPRLFVVIVEFFILAFLGGCKVGLQVYTAITIGHQAKKHVVLAALGVYIGTSVVEVILMDILDNIGVTEAVGRMMWDLSPFAQFNFVTFVAIILGGAICAVYYFICRWFLKNKLNLA